MSYDRYGNRLSQSQTYDAPPTNSVTVSATTNQITGSPYAYDANGNMTNDGNNTLVYDAVNRVLSATNGGSAGTYTYDGNSLRVKKVSASTTTVYIFSGTKVVAEYVNGASPTAPTREYIYSGRAVLAKIESGATKYYHQDHLSNRVVADSNGNVLEQLGHYPFGESWYNATNNKLQFTSYERDSESGNDYAMVRFYANRLARFSSPDSYSGSISNPQSLNRFAYVLNDPANFVDPLGLDTTVPCTIDGQPALCATYPVGTGGDGEGGDDNGDFGDLFGGALNDPPPPLIYAGGRRTGGARGPTVDLKTLDFCTKGLYGINSLGISLSQEGNGKLGSATNGQYSGVNLSVLSPKPLLFFSVTNDANNGTCPSGQQGYVMPDNPYMTFTNPYLTQPLLAGIQIVELGNALDLISGKQTADQALLQDGQQAQTPNPLIHNNNSPPGLDLLNCLMVHGGFIY
jgi:RHS repeat-associated protein